MAETEFTENFNDRCVASNVEGAAEGVAQSGFGSAKDQAFRGSVV